jgi:tetratricopeptide (TPR) repeat protein
MSSNFKPDHDALHRLADALAEDMVNTPPAELLAEVAEDHGDPRVLALEFDRVFARAHSRHAVRRGAPSPFWLAGDRLLGTIRAWGERRWLRGGRATQIAVAALATLLIATPIVWQTLSTGPVPGRSDMAPPVDGGAAGGVPRGMPPVAGRDSADAAALRNRCWDRAVAGQLQAALADCDESLRLRPDDADASNNRAFTYLKLGRLDDAIRDYDRALRLDPKIASSLYGRGLAKLRKGDAAGGSSDIAAAEAIRPSIRSEFERYGMQ